MPTTTIDVASGLTTDERCRALARGLLQLTPRELSQLYDALIADPDRVVVDTVNYDIHTDSWCPLAVGLGVPEIARSRGGISSNTDAKRLILEVGREKHGQFSLNPISGVDGMFFQHDRYSDLIALVEYILDNYYAMQQSYGWETTPRQSLTA